MSKKQMIFSGKLSSYCGVGFVDPRIMIGDNELGRSIIEYLDIDPDCGETNIDINIVLTIDDADSKKLQSYAFQFPDPSSSPMPAK